MRKRLRLVVIATTGLALGFLALSPHVRVVGDGFTFKSDPTCLCGRSFGILSPLRDRGPERVASALLESRSSTPTRVLAHLRHRSSEDQAHILDREQESPPESWRVTTRETRGDTAVVRFSIKRRGGVETSATISTVRDHGSWVVTDYAPVY